MAQSEPEGSESNLSKWIKKLTGIIVALAALIGALGGFERIGPVSCKYAYSGLPWCENPISISVASFWGPWYADLEHDIKLLLYMKDKCDKRSDCEINVHDAFQKNADYPNPPANSGIGFKYYCGDTECSGAFYSFESRFIRCPLGKISSLQCKQ
jgi:hypothetical protein